MYKDKYKIGDFNRRVLFENWVFDQDAGGGNVKRLNSAFDLWAKIEQRRGSEFINAGSDTWTYGSRVITRAQANVVSTTTMVFNGSRYKISSLGYDDEGHKRFFVIDAEMQDLNFVTGSTFMGSILFISGTGAQDQTDFSVPSINGKTVFGAYKDGDAFTILTSGTPSGKQVKIPGDGSAEWGIPFNDSEPYIFQYY